jgi:hypothetical protein
MTGRAVSEDHQGGDASPAAVTCAFGGRDRGKEYCGGSCGTQLAHNFRVIHSVGKMMFEHQAGDGPFTCDDDGKPIT